MLIKFNRPEYLDDRQHEDFRLLCNLFDLYLDPLPSLRGHIRFLYLANDEGQMTKKSLVPLVRDVIVYLPCLQKLTLEVGFSELVKQDGKPSLPYPTYAIDYATGVKHEWGERSQDRMDRRVVAIIWDAGAMQTLTCMYCSTNRSVLRLLQSSSLSGNGHL